MQLDDSLVEQQREAYKVKGVDENEPAVLQQKKKRKQNGDVSTPLPLMLSTEIEMSVANRCIELLAIQESGNSHAPKAKKPRTNTAVYVTSIPLDATVEEIHDVFCKCGVIAEEIDSSRPRIKMYLDENGNFKGDALVVYFRPESVDLAIQMLDDSDFRLGETGPQGNMRVQKADFSFKAQQEAPEKPNMRDKAKIIKKTQRLKKYVGARIYGTPWNVQHMLISLFRSKLTDWDDEDAAILQPSGRWEKVVVLKHMFTQKELEVRLCLHSNPHKIRIQQSNSICGSCICLLTNLV